jgi:hypothetical protein
MRCGVSGAIQASASKYVYADFTDCQCPNCDILTRPMLAIVMHPTWQEMLDSGPPEDKARAQRLIAQNKELCALKA